jgi:hypothetical protein
VLFESSNNGGKLEEEAEAEAEGLEKMKASVADKLNEESIEKRKKLDGWPVVQMN